VGWQGVSYDCRDRFSITACPLQDADQKLCITNSIDMKTLVKLFIHIVASLMLYKARRLMLKTASMIKHFYTKRVEWKIFLQPKAGMLCFIF
jgi:hypothetical protein